MNIKIKYIYLCVIFVVILTFLWTFVSANTDFDQNINWNLLVKEPVQVALFSVDKEKLADWVINTWNKFVFWVRKWINSTSQDQIIHDNGNTLMVFADQRFQNTMIGFEDIKTNPRKIYIDILQQHGIVNWYANKYYPQNYIPLTSFVKVLVETYRFKVWYNLKRNVGLTRKQYFSDIWLQPSVQKYVSTAYELWFLDGVIDSLATSKDFENEVNYNVLVAIFENVAKQFPELVNKYYVGEFFASDILIKKDQMAEYVLKVFDIPLDQDNDRQRYHFLDTKYHIYGEYAEILSDFGVVNTQNTEFYPDNNTYRVDFVLMLTNVLMHVQGEVPLSKTEIPVIVDIEGKTYAQQVNYAAKFGILDYLLEVKRWSSYLYPKQVVTKHEVYHILTQIANAQIMYDTQQADNQNITRWELAKLLVEVFDLENESPQEKHVVVREKAHITQSDFPLELLVRVRSFLANL